MKKTVVLYEKIFKNYKMNTKEKRVYYQIGENIEKSLTIYITHPIFQCIKKLQYFFF
jgi:hypothetical protein